MKDVGRDVLPLPVPSASPDGVRVLQALNGGTSLRDALRDVKKSTKRMSQSVWLFLVVALFHYLAVGFSEVGNGGVALALTPHLSAAQR